MSCPNEQPDREIDLTEFPTARAALDHAHATDGRAIRMGGRYYAVGTADAQWLETFGSVFEYLTEAEGQIVATPVNS